VNIQTVSNTITNAASQTPVCTCKAHLLYDTTSGVVVIKTLLERWDERPPQAEKFFGPAHCCRRVL